jgi:hypothetical protein
LFINSNLTPLSSHLYMPQYAIKDRRVRELEDEAMLLQQRTQEAEQELKKATSCHQAQIAKLNAQCSSLLESFNIIRYQHNATVQGLLQRLEETEVRVQHAACQCCCCGC